MTPLDDKQRAVAAENVWIVYWAVGRFVRWDGYSLHEHDLFSAGQYALVNALANDTYREGRGVNFKGWLVMCVRWAVVQEARRYRTPAGVRYGRYYYGRKFAAYPPDPLVDPRRDFADAVDNADAVERLLAHVSPRDASHLRRNAEGWSFRELGDEYGVDRTSIYVRCRKAAEVIRSTPTCRQLAE